MTEIINNGLALQMELVMLMVLHDKFGFGAQRCSRALEEFEMLWGNVNEQRLSLDDIADVVKNEIGLEVREEEMQIVPKGKR